MTTTKTTGKAVEAKCGHVVFVATEGLRTFAIDDATKAASRKLCPTCRLREKGELRAERQAEVEKLVLGGMSRPEAEWLVHGNDHQIATIRGIE